MNVENIKKVRDLIAGLPPEQFSMNYWGLAHHPCGSVACIGGWAEAILLPDGNRTKHLPEHVVCEALGLDPEQGGDLFYPGGNYYQASIPEAVQVLDHPLETGEVDWSIIGGDQ